MTGVSARHRQRWRFVVFVVLAGVLLAGRAWADTLQVSNPGTGFAPLGGTWQLHLGDDKAWADPSLNDTSWEPIRVDSTWGAQTHPGYIGYAWYRQRIEVQNSGPAGSKELAVFLPQIQDAYEVYWNGEKIGSAGHLPPGANWAPFSQGAVYPLPSLSGVLALRVWKAPLSSVDAFEVGGLTDVPLLGDAKTLAIRNRSISYGRDERRLPVAFISAVTLVIGTLSFLLYLRDRKEGLYLWLALYLVSGGIIGLRGLSMIRDTATFHSYQLQTQLLSSCQDISMWLILLSLFAMTREPRWRRATAWLITIYLTAQVIDITTIYFWEIGGVLPWIDGITTAVYVITPLYVFVIIAFGLFRRNRLSLWPLIVAVCANALYASADGLAIQGIRFTHLTLDQRVSNLGFHAGSYFFGLVFILNTLLFLALIFTIAREQFLERERQSRIELEIKSAQEVQQILVPEESPAIPGLSIASVYRPAEEVGGDFFQVIPLDDGGALIALGDVSGKGLKAAMTVSLIVGALRTLAEYTESPAAILQGLNRRLLGRVNGGFATCLVARIGANGDTWLANAGHLAPFRDRDELPLDGSLPLGLSPEMAYDELTFVLHAGETLTFYTDGLLEARNAAGELYGFDRLASLIRSEPTIEQMVEEACRFGQQDDITVFQVTRLAQSAPAHAARLSMATQIAGAVHVAS
jgi:Stage II sporulation protein E (SpoIIE)